tara:strand:+ start:187 stop:480 length:294 start_codon:yes stop_codon:yes gene_type:complete
MTATNRPPSNRFKYRSFSPPGMGRWRRPKAASIGEAVATGNGVGFVSKPEFGYDSRLDMVELLDCKLPMHEYMVCLENRAETRVVHAFWEMAIHERD